MQGICVQSPHLKDFAVDCHPEWATSDLKLNKASYICMCVCVCVCVCGVCVCVLKGHS